MFYEPHALSDPNWQRQNTEKAPF